MAIAGAVVRWLQDNLGIVSSSEELGRPGGELWSLSPSFRLRYELFSPQRSWRRPWGRPTAVTSFPPSPGSTLRTGSPAPEGETGSWTKLLPASLTPDP